MITTSQKQTEAPLTFFSFIDAMATRLASDPYSAGALDVKPVTRHLPGLLPLFNSLASPSWTQRDLGNRTVEEWNPLSQRALLPDPIVPTMKDFERDFNLILAHSQTFVEWAHEAMHILVLELFFCGKRQFESHEDIRKWYSAGEAFSFWYADIIATRAIRKIIPNGETIYGRSALSNLTFHPEEAFRRVGVNSDFSILEIYVDSFLEKDSILSNSLDPFCQHLSQKFQDFNSQTITPLKYLYNIFVELDMDEFLRRFTAIDNLPSLFSKKLLNIASKLTVEEYLVFLAQRLLPEMETCSVDKIFAVCQRRQIQTRAYYAWTMYKLLLKKRVKSCTDINYLTIIKALEKYLSSLQKTLKLLAEKSNSKDIQEYLIETDARYDKDIYQPLLDSKAYVTYRPFLHPFFEPTNGRIGLSENDYNPTRGEMVAGVQHILSLFDWSIVFRVDGDHETIAVLYSFLTLAKIGKIEDVRKEYNSIMTRPDILPYWSVYLAEIRPTNNKFRELAFKFA